MHYLIAPRYFILAMYYCSLRVRITYLPYLLYSVDEKLQAAALMMTDPFGSSDGNTPYLDNNFMGSAYPTTTY